MIRSFPQLITKRLSSRSRNRHYPLSAILWKQSEIWSENWQFTGNDYGWLWLTTVCPTICWYFVIQLKVICRSVPHGIRLHWLALPLSTIAVRTTSPLSFRLYVLYTAEFLWRNGASRRPQLPTHCALCFHSISHRMPPDRRHHRNHHLGVCKTVLITKEVWFCLC